MPVGDGADPLDIAGNGELMPTSNGLYFSLKTDTCLEGSTHKGDFYVRALFSLQISTTASKTVWFLI